MLGALLHTAGPGWGAREPGPGPAGGAGGGGPGTPVLGADAPELTGNPDETMGLRSVTLPGARR